MAGTQFAVDLVFKTQGSNQLKAATGNVKKLQDAAKKAQGSVNQASNNIRKFGQSSTAASAGSNKLATSLKAMVVQLAAVTAATVGVQQSLSAAFERGNAEKRLQNLTSGTAEYEQALRLARIAAADFGVTQTQATQALGDVYSRLSGVGYGLTEVNEIYRGFNTIAAQSGVAAEDAAGAFLQLGQALGSGKLQGDELRSILERMPQLAQAIAAEMGIAAGEVRQAGADGKITGDVMYKALKKASDGSFDLTKTLSKQQVTMNEVRQRAEELQVSLGESLAPVFLSAMNTLGEYALVAANAFKKLNEWTAANAETIKKVVTIGLEIGKIVASVMLVVKVYTLWQKAVAGVAAAKAALLAMTGIGLVKVAAGAAAAVGAYALLTKGIDGVENAVTGLQAEQAKSLEADKAAAAANADLFKKRGEGTEKAIDDTKKLAEAQKEVTAKIKETQAEIEKVYSAQESIAELSFELAQKRRDVEQQIVSNLLDQAEAQLKAAATAQEREIAAKKIYDLTIQQAKIEKEIAQAAVKEDLRKAEAQVEMLVMKEKEVAIEVSLAAANKTLNQEHLNALALTRDALGLAQQQLGVKQQIAAAQMSEIDAIYKGKEATAKMAYEQNRVFEATKQSESSAAGFATQMERAAAAAGKIKGGGSQPWSLGKKTTFVADNNWNGASVEAINAAFEQNQGIKNYGRQDDDGNWHIAFGSQKVEALNPHSAKRLKYDIQALIDRESRQQDPNSNYNQMLNTLAIEKAKQAEQYQASQSGNANVSVEYNGDRINMNDNDYVSTKDVSGIVNSAVSAMQNKMTRSSKSRLEMGMT